MNTLKLIQVNFNYNEKFSIGAEIMFNITVLYPTFFYENLVDFNEALLHEATLNLHTHS